MKKNAVKIISIVLITAVILSLGTTFVHAANNSSGSGFIVSPGDITASETNASAKVETLSGQILGIVQVIAVAVAVIMLIVLAIKYITAAPNDKADIKKSATIYVVGALILFAATGILEIVKGFAENI